MTATHTPGPWQVVPEDKAESPWIVGTRDGGSIASCEPVGPWMSEQEASANARLIATAPELLEALKAVSGYLLNAKIDLETGAPKKTAVATIEGGLKIARTAIFKVEHGT